MYPSKVSAALTRLREIDNKYKSRIIDNFSSSESSYDIEQVKTKEDSAKEVNKVDIRIPAFGIEELPSDSKSISSSKSGSKSSKSKSKSSKYESKSTTTKIQSEQSVPFESKSKTTAESYFSSEIEEASSIAESISEKFEAASISEKSHSEPVQDYDETFESASESDNLSESKSEIDSSKTEDEKQVKSCSNESKSKKKSISSKSEDEEKISRKSEAEEKVSNKIESEEKSETKSENKSESKSLVGTSSRFDIESNKKEDKVPAEDVSSSEKVQQPSTSGVRNVEEKKSDLGVNQVGAPISFDSRDFDIDPENVSRESAAKSKNRRRKKSKKHIYEMKLLQEKEDLRSKKKYPKNEGRIIRPLEFPYFSSSELSDETQTTMQNSTNKCLQLKHSLLNIKQWLKIQLQVYQKQCHIANEINFDYVPTTLDNTKEMVCQLRKTVN